VIITAKTKVAGVVGNPIKHSLSPRLHNAWIQRAGLDAVYVAFEPRIENFENFVRGMVGGAIVGVNVTVPFKEHAFRLADLADDAARDAKAANVLLFREDGTIEAKNTDGEGLVYAFKHRTPHLDLGDDRPVTVLGAGGAAKGAIAALLKAGVSKIRILNRTKERAEDIARQFPGRVEVYEWSVDSPAFSANSAVINATSLGLIPGQNLSISFTGVPEDAVIMDMVYGKDRTFFLVEAKRTGRTIIDGLDMLIGQAVPSFKAFFDMDPPKLDERRLLLRAAQKRRVNGL
jgi:shikimate dehydrogenase